jgi:hypothetical protein
MTPGASESVTFEDWADMFVQVINSTITDAAARAPYTAR